MAQPVTHVIFDVDGLLLDTESVYTEVSTKLLKQHGLTLTYDIKRKLMGRKPTEASQVLVQELSAPFTAEQWMTMCHQYLTPERWNLVSSLPGAERLVLHLDECKIPMAAATGCLSSELEHKMKNHPTLIGKMRHAVASGDDPEVTYGKPAPDIFRIAAARFVCPPVSPESVLVFEDSPLGVEAAIAAGMQAVWIPCIDEPPADAPETIPPSAVNRVSRISSLLEFKPEAYGLPKFP